MNIPDWCAPPIISGAWTDLEGTEALTMAHEIGAVLGTRPMPVEDVRVERLRVRPLACYPGALLVEMQARMGEQAGLSNHIYGSWGMVTLDGTSAVVHDINAIEGALTLETPVQAADYQLLFCNVVRGDEGRFRVVAAPEPFRWQAGADADEAAALLAEPVAVRRVSKHWVIEAPVFYAGALFRAEFELQRNGMIEMVDDNPLPTPFPVEAESWTGPFRIPQPGVAA